MANPTPQDIIDAAIDRAALNDVNLVDTNQSLAFISTKQREVFSQAARLDPEFFGKDDTTAAAAHYTDGWDLTDTPGDLAGVTEVYVEDMRGTVTNVGTAVAVGTRVNLVTRRWPGLDIPPRATLRGRKIVGYGSELGTNDSNMVTQLRVYYPEMPGELSTLTDPISLPGEWKSLLVLPLAKLYAIRDQRLEEVPLLDAELTSAQKTFVESILSYSHGVRRPLQQVPAIPLGQ